jgi:signal transduction histidine kinase
MSLKLRIFGTILVLGFFSILLIYLSTEHFLRQSIAQEKQDFVKILQIRTNENMHELERIQNQQALKLQQEKDFRTALQNKDKKAIGDWAIENFNRYFVTAGVIDLTDIMVFDANLDFLASADVERIDICENLLLMARQRQGADRLKSMSSLCASGRYAVLVPAGGLKVKGYLLVVSNAAHFLKNIEIQLGLPLAISDEQGSDVYQSSKWNTDYSDTHQFTGTISLTDLNGNARLALSSLSDRSEFVELLYRTRMLVIAGTMLLMMVFMIVVFFWFKRSFNSLDLLQDASEAMMKGDCRTIPYNNIHSEFRPVVDAFNQMILSLDQSSRRLQNALEDAQESREIAEQANHYKTVFLSNISHELRTPMQAILSFAKLALKRVDDEKAVKFLGNIEASGMRLLGMLNALLDLSKIEAGKMEINFATSNLRDVVYASIVELESLLGPRNLTIDVEGEDLIEAEFDDQLITQVVINLLSNAIKFSPDNASINITMMSLPAMPELGFKGVVELIVNDQGSGIPQGELESVFDKYVQSSKKPLKAGGTGLGLSICREIINQHDGLIWAESPLPGQDHGTSFHFILPKMRETALETSDSI